MVTLTKLFKVISIKTFASDIWLTPSPWNVEQMHQKNKKQTFVEWCGPKSAWVVEVFVLFENLVKPESQVTHQQCSLPL